MSDAARLFPSDSSETRSRKRSRDIQELAGATIQALVRIHLVSPADPLKPRHRWRGRISPRNGGRTNQSVEGERWQLGGGTEFGEIDAGGEEGGREWVEENLPKTRGERRGAEEGEVGAW